MSPSFNVANVFDVKRRRRKERTINENKMGIGKACFVVHKCIIQLDCLSSKSEQ